jgi:hypothetical protein
VDARSVLGVPALRPPFLDDVPAAQSREGEADDRDSLVTNSDVTNSDNTRCVHMTRYSFDDKIEIQDDIDDEEDDDEDVDEDDDDDDDDEDEDEEDVETWQVSVSGASR